MTQTVSWRAVVERCIQMAREGGRDNPLDPSHPFDPANLWPHAAVEMIADRAEQTRTVLLIAENSMNLLPNESPHWDQEACIEHLKALLEAGETA